MRGAVPALPQFASMAWCPVKYKIKHRYYFTFKVKLKSNDIKTSPYSKPF
jgi:hypothetical protein